MMLGSETEAADEVVLTATQESSQDETAATALKRSGYCDINIISDLNQIIFYLNLPIPNILVFLTCFGCLRCPCGVLPSSSRPMRPSKTWLVDSVLVKDFSLLSFVSQLFLFGSHYFIWFCPSDVSWSLHSPQCYLELIIGGLFGPCIGSGSSKLLDQPLQPKTSEILR